ncbi:MAG: hypothetical protein UZ18_ATM001001740, partial [Armatimonadetes bacterium OLB18]
RVRSEAGEPLQGCETGTSRPIGNWPATGFLRVGTGSNEGLLLCASPRRPGPASQKLEHGVGLEYVPRPGRLGSLPRGHLTNGVEGSESFAGKQQRAEKEQGRERKENVRPIPLQRAHSIRIAASEGGLRLGLLEVRDLLQRLLVLRILLENLTEVRNGLVGHSEHHLRHGEIVSRGQVVRVAATTSASVDMEPSKSPSKPWISPICHRASAWVGSAWRTLASSTLLRHNGHRTGARSPVGRLPGCPCSEPFPCTQLLAPLPEGRTIVAHYIPFIPTPLPVQDAVE